MSTKIKFLGCTFNNPIVLASGILGVTASSLKRCITLGAGGVTTKSLSLQPRAGHVNPTMAGDKHYFVNAVGLSNPGVEAGVAEIKEFKRTCSAPIIGSIFAGTIAEFEAVAKKICQSPIDILEINISCPNVGNEFSSPFAYNVEAASTITKAVKKIARKKSIPISIKLSPNAWNIADIAQACEKSGADAITAINTISGMAIQADLQAPILSNKVGGISGPALKPIALKCVWDIHESIKKIPIIATGGVITGEDAIEMMLSGGSLVGVGSAVYWEGPEVFAKIAKEMKRYMKKNKVTALTNLIGKAHR